MIIDPLDRSLGGRRLLTDRGIRQALELGLIHLSPPIVDSQIQPASVDMCFQKAEMDGSYDERQWTLPSLHDKKGPLVLHAHTEHAVMLSQLIETPTLYQDCASRIGFNHDARSSLRRLGVSTKYAGYYFREPTGLPTIRLANFSPNDILLSLGDRIVQFFFTPKVYTLEEQLWGEGKDVGEKVRSLDMGIELPDEAAIHYLHGREFTVTPRLVTQGRYLYVHASPTAYRFKTMGTINFSQRDRLELESILEPISITRGYEIKPGEHLIVETREQFTLSDKIGLRFWDATIGDLFEMFPDMHERANQFEKNMSVLGLPGGWVDPGYQGTFSRQPKWLTPGRVIQPGTPLGLAEVVYFPQGVERSYGDSRLRSQYQRQRKTLFSHEAMMV